ncbi:hypothetical protein KY285_016345 [Solanum tuberosum]|nr:hypothetical protein KY284_016339 [Solanum tuberosum]KAH0702067.1 hypothetical protein KY285_016345 [Solanum tuberosum]
MINTFGICKCSSFERLQFWNKIYSVDQNMIYPWMVGGDFNVILTPEEKIRGLPVYPTEVEDFACCINSCELVDIRFNGSSFTWWNGRADEECIFKRLDRILLIIREDIVRVKEQLFEHTPTSVNREVFSRTQAGYTKYLHFEEEFWRQKSVIQWFTEGDRNTKFFHNLIKGRSKRLNIDRIQRADGTWAEGNEVETEAIRFCHE